MMQKSSKQDSPIMYISHQRKQLLYRSVTLLCHIMPSLHCFFLFGVVCDFQVQPVPAVCAAAWQGDSSLPSRKEPERCSSNSLGGGERGHRMGPGCTLSASVDACFFLMFFSYIWRFLSQAFTHWWHCVRNVASSYFGKRTWRTTWRWMWAALSGLPAMLLQQTKVFFSKTYEYTCLEDPGLTPFHFSVDVFSLSTWGTFRSCCLGTRVCWGVIKRSFCVHSFCVSSEHGCQTQDLDKTLCISES